MRLIVERLHFAGLILPSSPILSTSVEHYVMGVSNKPGKPLVDDWECLKEMVDIWENTCGALDDYGRKYFRTFANLCNAGVEPGIFSESVKGICSSGEIREGVQGQAFDTEFEN